MFEILIKTDLNLFENNVNPPDLLTSIIAFPALASLVIIISKIAGYNPPGCCSKIS